VASRILVERIDASLLAIGRARLHGRYLQSGWGKLQADSWSDPRDASKYSAHDLISLGFINSPEHARLVENSKSITEISSADYDAILFVGGQGPMHTFSSDVRVHNVATEFYGSGKITAVLCRL
jgi:hypothetical protein